MIKYNLSGIQTLMSGSTHSMTSPAPLGGPYFQLCTSLETTMLQEPLLRTDAFGADVLSTGPRAPFSGDRPCSHYKIEATITPRYVGETATRMYSNLPMVSFDASGLTAMQNVHAEALQNYTTVVTSGRDKFYSSDSDMQVVFVTPLTKQFVIRRSTRGLPTSSGAYTMRYVECHVTYHQVSTKYWAIQITNTNRAQYVNPVTSYEKSYGIATITNVVAYAKANHTTTSTSHTLINTGKSGIPFVEEFLRKGELDPDGWVSSEVSRIKGLATPTTIPISLNTIASTLTYDIRASEQFSMDLLTLKCQSLISRATTNSYMRNKVSKGTWGDLAASAIDNCAFIDINTAAYVRDLRAFGSEVKGIIQLMENPTNIRGWASLYLGYRYGSRLTAADTQSLADGIRRVFESIKAATKSNHTKSRYLAVRAREDVILPTPFAGGTVQRKLNYKVYYEPSDVEIFNVMNALCNWDIFPTAGNIWDLIPYTFVLDWFIDVGNVLEELDRRDYESRLKVRGVTYTFKDVYDVPCNLSNLGFADTTFKITVYSRHISSTIHPVVMSGLLGLPSWTQVLDGIAMLIQRR